MSTFTTDSLLTCSRYSANPGYQRFAFSTETQKTRCEMIVTTKRLSSKAGHVIHVPINLYLAIYLSKSLRSVRSLKNWIVFFSKDVIHWSSNLLQKFKLFCFVCLCFFFIHQKILKKVYHSLHKNVKQHNAFIIIHINVSWAANQHIIMISEGTCDTEAWKYKNRKVISYCNNIPQNVCFTVFLIKYMQPWWE